MAIKITDLTAQDNAKALDWLLMVDRDDQDMSEWGTNKKIAVYHMAQSMFDMTPPSYFLNKKLIGYEPGQEGELSQNDTILSAISKTRTLIDSKAPINSPLFSGNVRLPYTTSIGNVNASEIDYLVGVTGPIQTQLNSKAPINNPTFTGTVTLPTGSANTVPLKFVSGVLKTGTLIAGSVEYDGTKLYLTNGSTPLTRVGIATETFVTDRINDLINNAPGALDTLAEIAAAIDDDANFVTTMTGLINERAPKADAVFSGTITLPSTTSIGNVNASEIGYLDGVTSSIQNQFLAKAPIDSPDFTGDVTLPSTTSIGPVTSAEISYLGGLTGNIQDQLDTNIGESALALKANINSPAFTGTVSLPDGTSNSAPLRFSSVNTLKTGPASGAVEYDGANFYITNSSLARKTIAVLESPTFTGTVTAPTFEGTFKGSFDSTVTVANFTGNLAGDVTGTQNVTSISNTTVNGKLLEGYAAPAYTTEQTIAASDSILTAFRKIAYNSSIKVSAISPTFIPASGSSTTISLKQEGASGTVSKTGYVYFSNESGRNKSAIGSEIATDGGSNLTFSVSPSTSPRPNDSLAEAARFTPDGRLLIGVSTGGGTAKLVVNGTLRTNNIVVTPTTGAADTTLSRGTNAAAITVTLPSVAGTLVVSDDDRINNLHTVATVSTATYTITSADNNKYLRCTHTSPAIALTLDGSGGTTPWKTGMTVVIRRHTNAGALTLATTNGATINDNYIADIVGGDTFALKCIDATSKTFDFI
jgi:hypothetical protein